MRQRQNKKVVFGDDGFEAKPAVETKKPYRDDRQRSEVEHTVKHTKTKHRDTNGTKYVRFDSDQEDEEDETRTKHIDKKGMRLKAEKLLSSRQQLPVYKAKDELVPKVVESKVSIVIGETGSGKSTQLPQFLMEHSQGCVAVTQPRRVAAINLATRVAEEHGVSLGKEVGYSVRFGNMNGSKTRLKYMTDGMLLREMMLDPELKKYSTVVVDEAHERSILTDLLLGFLKQLVTTTRKDDADFRVVVMSATLDAEKFSHFFDDAPIFFIEGRMYPVERFYLDKPSDDVIDSMIKTIVQVNQGEQTGDILCFLPGQDDIDKTVTLLEKIAPQLPKDTPMLVPLPLYAALPPQQQMKVFEKVQSHQRKVILSTNIAETSVTVPGIRYVIDSGLRKVKVWRHELGLSTLLTVPISKASAAQRTGRAGREAPGKCFRLYSEKDYIKLSEATEPEILRSEIVSPVLMLKRLKVDNILGWNWLENPGKQSLFAALQQLYSLKALSDSGKITEKGEKMVVLPVAPHLAAVLIQAAEYGVLQTVIDIVSCLSVDNLVLVPSTETRDEINAKRKDTCTLGSRYGDLVMLKELYDIYVSFSDNSERRSWCKELGVSYRGFKNVLRIRKQIQGYMSSMVPETDDEEDFDPALIIKSFLCGFVTNTAIGMPDRSYHTVTTGDLISIHPSSLLFGKKLDAIMYIEHVYTVKGYARNVSAVELDWLQEAAPNMPGMRISA